MNDMTTEQKLLLLVLNLMVIAIGTTVGLMIGNGIIHQIDWVHQQEVEQ